MERQNLSGIVVYTIHGGEEQNPLRDSLHKKITDKYGDNPLDESTYGLNINAEVRGDVVDTLKQFCKESEKESKRNFSENDFVNLYYPTHKEENKKECWIHQEIILKKEQNNDE